MRLSEAIETLEKAGRTCEMIAGEILVDGKITGRADVLAMAEPLAPKKPDAPAPQPKPIAPPRVRREATPSDVAFIKQHFAAAPKPARRSKAAPAPPPEDPLERLAADVEACARDLDRLERSLAAGGER